MAKTIALLAVTLFSLLSLGCSSKTEALANKSLMSRPLLHQPNDASSQHENAGTQSASNGTSQ